MARVSASELEPAQPWRPLPVVSQEAIRVEPGTSDARVSVDAAVQTLPVIETSPKIQPGKAIVGIRTAAGVGDVKLSV